MKSVIIWMIGFIADIKITGHFSLDKMAGIEKIYRLRHLWKT